MTTDRAVSDDAVEAAARAMAKVRPLVWSQSRVFGYMKRRGFSPFGEFVSFDVTGLTPDQVAEKDAAAQTDYEARIRSALSAPPPQPEVAGLVEVLRRAEVILSNMARENEGAIFSHNRWPINHEPLRADARNALPAIRAALASMDGGPK